MTKRILILGAGKIGTATRTLLRGIGVEADIADQIPRDGAKEIHVGENAQDLVPVLQGYDAVINAMPFGVNRTVAGACALTGAAYFDFSEDVATTDYVRALAHVYPKTTFVPQCGLAPGAVNIFAANLIKAFDGPVRRVDMRVGALPLSTTNAMKYYLSWSTAGLINEYRQPCDMLYRGKPMKVLPLDGLERVVIDGIEYEAFNTSGGISTMCETYAGRIEEMTYKTLRYPGHCEHMRFLFKDLNLESRPELLEQIFTQDVALTMDDVVILYVSAIGVSNGQLRQMTTIRKIRPWRNMSAIQCATAAGMVGAVELWKDGKIGPGFVQQDEIAVGEFRHTVGGSVYEHSK